MIECAAGPSDQDAIPKCCGNGVCARIVPLDDQCPVSAIQEADCTCVREVDCSRARCVEVARGCAEREEPVCAGRSPNVLEGASVNDEVRRCRTTRTNRTRNSTVGEFRDDVRAGVHQRAAGEAEGTR